MILSGASCSCVHAGLWGGEAPGIYLTVPSVAGDSWPHQALLPLGRREECVPCWRLCTPIASNTDHEDCHFFRDKGCLRSFPNKLRFLLSVVWRKERSLSADIVFRGMVPSQSRCSPLVDFKNFNNSLLFLPLFLSPSLWLGQPGFCQRAR